MVEARYIVGSDRAVIISAGPHASETSGVVGCSRAAHQLSGEPEAHFVISPMENPDGYALQGRLIATQSRHMHHSVRYTAFGNDLQSQPRFDSHSNMLFVNRHPLSVMPDCISICTATRLMSGRGR